RKILLLVVGMILLCGQLLAQNRTITGKVTDEKGSPLSNAKILIQGTNNGTSTKSDGSFSLSVPSGATALSVSIIGYITRTVSIENRSEITISMTNDGQKLDEVVVTAYGATAKKAYTGTASTIKGESFKDLQVTTITGVLQGNASGVLAVSSNGQPGESPAIRIRGVGSVLAAADPLILVDGAPYGGNINNINPNDIESITVLKDASSTALYGSRAANGILSITTRI